MQNKDPSSTCWNHKLVHISRMLRSCVDIVCLDIDS